MKLLKNFSIFAVFETGWTVKLTAQQKIESERQYGREMTSESFWDDIRLTHQQRLLLERQF